MIRPRGESRRAADRTPQAPRGWSGRPGTAGLLALLLPVSLGLTGACRVPSANVHNLREVRDPDGTASYTGATMTEIEWLLRGLLLANMSGGSFDLASKEPSAIADPDGVALENLVALARCSSRNLHTRGLQVEMAAWLAVDDPYVLARERAVLELARLGPLVGATEPRVPPADAADATTVAGLLQEILRDTRPFLEGSPIRGDAERLAETCARVSAVPLDRDGARRLLSATNVLLKRGGFDDEDLSGLRALHDDLQRRSVELALAQTLADPSGIVRAAALEACAEISDNGLATLQLDALRDPDTRVVKAVLDSVRRRGLPRPPGGELAPEERAGYEEAWFDPLVTLTASLDGDVSAAACLALEEVSGAGIRSLRWEDWARWWRARGGVLEP